MSFALISQFAGSLCLYLMNCSVALATAYGLGSIFKAPMSSSRCRERSTQPMRSVSSAY